MSQREDTRQEKRYTDRSRRERELRRRQLRRRRYRMALCLRAMMLLTGLTFFVFFTLWGISRLSGIGSGVREQDENGDGMVQISAASLPDAGADSTGGRYEQSGRREEELPFDLDDPLLILVNTENPLPEDYEAVVRVLDSGMASVAEAAYDDLTDMLSDGKKEGLRFVVCSGYRSAQRQQELLDEDVRACMARGMSYEEAYAEVTRTTMPPRCSEHSTGLALDIVALDHQLLDDAQENTPENRWLRENAWRYGFILRYPRGQEDITGIDYESWHFRYVGKEAARYMQEHELLLEELWQS